MSAVLDDVKVDFLKEILDWREECILENESRSWN
jgi:hypothetical protein